MKMMKRKTYLPTNTNRRSKAAATMVPAKTRARTMTGPAR
jgi:hypothetical protein